MLVNERKGTKSMAEPTLSEVFGISSTQDAATLVVSKSDWLAVGLTATAANTAESLIVSIILKALPVLTETNRLNDLPNRNIAIAFTGQDLIDQGGGNVFLRDTYQVSLYRQTTITAVDPDNY